METIVYKTFVDWTLQSSSGDWYGDCLQFDTCQRAFMKTETKYKI